MEGKNKIAMALSLAKRAGPKEEPQEQSQEGTKCYACGGMVQKMNEGGGVDDSYDAESISDTDGDDDDLVYSPEVSSSDFSKEEDDNEDAKKNSFLKSYMISRKMRQG